MNSTSIDSDNRTSRVRRLRAAWAATWREIVVFLFFTALAIFATRPLIAHMQTQMLDFSDPFIDLWTIDWLSQHFFEPSLLFHGNTYYPEPHAVLYSDLSLGTVVLLLPFRLFLDDPVALYNIAVLLALAFGGWAFHALVRDLTGSRSAGLLTGILSAFCSHQIYYVYHLNLLTVGWLALFLLGLYRLLRKPTRGASFLTGVAFALNAQSSGYYAVSAALIALIFAIVYMKALGRRKQIMSIASALGIAVILLSPYLVSYMTLRGEERLHRPLAMSERMSFDPSQDLGHDGHLYRRWISREGEQLFPGLLALVLTGLAWSRRRPHVVFFSLSAIVCLVISLGPSLRIFGLETPMPYALLHRLPPLNSMRHPFTFATVTVFLLAVLAGLGWSGLAIARRRWAGAVIVALALIETASPPPRRQGVPFGLPHSYQMLRVFSRAPILEIPLYAKETLLWAARHDMPMVNGQGAAFVPFRIRALEAMITNQWLRRYPRDIDGSKPAQRLREMYDRLYVIIPSERKPELKPLANAFDRSSTFRLFAISTEGDRIYRMGTCWDAL